MSSDGSKSLTKESKTGLAVSFALTLLATAALSWLTGLDTSQWSGWWASAGVALVSAVAGLLAAYLKRNT